MIQDISEIAKTAGRKILEIYKSGNLGATEKLDFSPLTKADLASELIISTELARITHELIISEENPDLLTANFKAPHSYWLVDPLDGTKDFIAGKDSFVVSIARIENSRPVLGVLYAPVYDELYCAELGKGATCNGQKIFNRSERKDLQAVASGSQTSERMQRLISHFSIQSMTRYGSALKFGRVARGDFDLYPRFGPTYEWDTAAGQIIAEEGGCQVLSMETGQSLRYGKTDLLNHGFLVCRQDLNMIKDIQTLLKE
jgi:3'(2'), 5'-bisphosphate nucleotidase